MKLKHSILPGVALLAVALAQPVLADKPGWAGNKEKPSREQVEEHREEMKAKRGSAEAEMDEARGKGDKWDKGEKGDKDRMKKRDRAHQDDEMHDSEMKRDQDRERDRDQERDRDRAQDGSMEKQREKKIESAQTQQQSEKKSRRWWKFWQ